jgi:hypothetical protein
MDRKLPVSRISYLLHLINGLAQLDNDHLPLSPTGPRVEMYVTMFVLGFIYAMAMMMSTGERSHATTFCGAFAKVPARPVVVLSGVVSHYRRRVGGEEWVLGERLCVCELRWRG